MRLSNLKSSGQSGSVLVCFILTGLLIISGCMGSNLLKPSSFRQKAESDRADWEKAISESQTSHLNWSTSYPQALQTATRERKLLMAHFTGSDWCTWCVKLEEEVFDTPKFQEWANQNVVPMKLDFPKTTKLDRELRTQNNQLLEKYRTHVKGYPTVLFIDPTRGDVVAKMGYAKGGPEGWISKAESKLQ